MNIQKLINDYDKAADEEKARQEKKKLDAIEACKAAVVKTAKEHLGDLWGELAPGEIKHYFSNPRSTYEIDFYIPVSFQGIEGKIKQGKSNLFAEAWGYMSIDFDFFGANTSLPASDAALGEVFSRVNKKAQENNEKAEVIRQNNRRFYMDFRGLNAEAVTNHLNEGIARFPEHEADLRKNAEERMAILAHDEEEKLRRQLARDLRKSEEEQLQLLVDFAWDRELVVYCVRYGAKIHMLGTPEEDTPNIYTDRFYTLMDEPLNNGMWMSFQAGQYDGWIHPYNIISLEKVTIKNSTAAPADLCRWVTIQSRNLTDVNIVAAIPPIELFAFDYDELRVAMEKKQDAEISDATQEE